MEKQSAQIALVKLDLQDVIEKLTKQASYRLRDVDMKQLEGMEPQDFVQLTILKVLDGTRDWMNSTSNNMFSFLRICLASEISNFLKAKKRHGYSETDEELDDYIEEDGTIYKGHTEKSY